MNTMIDLNLRAWAFRRAEITGIGTWLHVDGGYRPVMALVRTGDETAGAYIITMDKAWIWDERIGDGAQAAEQIHRIAQVLRLDAEARTIFKIFSFINDHLDDLICMPSLPPKDRPREVIAEVTVTNKVTGETYEAELHDV